MRENLEWSASQVDSSGLFNHMFTPNLSDTQLNRLRNLEKHLDWMFF